MGSFGVWREGNRVPLYGYIFEGITSVCVFREFTIISLEALFP